MTKLHGRKLKEVGQSLNRWYMNLRVDLLVKVIRELEKRTRGDLVTLFFTLYILSWFLFPIKMIEFSFLGQGGTIT